MHALRILLRHRVTRWLRHPEWGTGTVVGQIVLLGLLLVFLWPVGMGSYMFGAGIRELYPDLDVLWVLNSGMLYLVPALTLARFFLQSPPSDQLAPYLDLPVRRRAVLRGQAAFTLLSVHTVFAIVIVGPVWVAEVGPVLSMVEAGVWLVVALLLVGVVPAFGMQLLNVLLGRHPKWFLSVLLVAAGGFGVNAILEASLLQSASRLVFGTPFVGLALSMLAAVGTYAALLRVMEAQIEVDRRASSRTAGASSWGMGIYRWIETTLPTGRLVALELRQVVRTRRMRGLALMGIAIVLGFFGLFVAELVLEETAEPSSSGVLNIAFWGLGGTLLGVSVQAFAVSADHMEGMLARPHRLASIVMAKMGLLWAGLVPGTLLLLALLPWLPLRVGALFGGCAVYWWGVIVPWMVYLGPQMRTPVDLSASAFSFNGSLGNLTGLALVPIILVVIVGSVVAATASAWWIVAVLTGGAGLLGLGGLIWTLRPFVRQLDRHRHEMIEGFRENESI